MDNLELDIGEIAAIITALGALAATLSNDSGGGSARPIIDLPDSFGREDSGSDTDTDDSTDEWDGDSSVTEPADETLPEGRDGDSTLPDGEWNYEDDNPDWSEDDFDFGGLPENDTSDSYEWGGATGDDPAGGDAGTDDSTGGASPGDTTTGGTTDPGDTGLVDVGWDDVAGVGDHLAGSTDEWFGRQTEGLW